MMVPSNVTLLLCSGLHWRCFSGEVANHRNWKTADMPERMEVIRTTRLKKALTRRQGNAIAHLPSMMAIRLAAISREVVLTGKG